MPDLDPAQLNPRSVYRLLTSLVAPRPIAWVSTVAPDGTLNLAPHSFFNLVSHRPPIVHFTSSGESGEKDSLRNARETGEFVVNVVTRELVDEMNLTSADFPPQESEFAWASLETAPSTRVRTPRVAASRAALECRVESILTKGTGRMVFGEVVHVHIDDSVWRDGAVDPSLLQLVGRLGGNSYADTSEVFDRARPTWQQLRQDAADQP